MRRGGFSLDREEDNGGGGGPLDPSHVGDQFGTSGTPALRRKNIQEMRNTAWDSCSNVICH